MQINTIVFKQHHLKAECWTYLLPFAIVVNLKTFQWVLRCIPCKEHRSLWWQWTFDYRDSIDLGSSNWGQQPRIWKKWFDHRHIVTYWSWDEVSFMNCLFSEALEAVEAQNGQSLGNICLNRMPTSHLKISQFRMRTNQF